VVERRIRGVPPVELADVPGSGGVGLVESPSSGVEVDSLPGRAPRGSSIDRSVESHMEQARASAQRRRSRPPEHHRALALEQAAEGVVVLPADAARQVLGIALGREVPLGAQQREALEERAARGLCQLLRARPLRRVGRWALRAAEPIDEGQAETLARAGIDFVNHNLNTSRRFYPSICSTHTYDDRVATVKHTVRAGLAPCSGVIVGMGETAEDLVEAAMELRRLAVVSLPVNFLHPIDGTPLGDRVPPTSGECLRALALFRLTNPRADLRAAGGRERCLGAAQGLALFAANSLFVGGYLTTPGQQRDEAVAMIETRGFEGGGAPRRYPPAAMDRAAQM